MPNMLKEPITFMLTPQITSGWGIGTEIVSLLSVSIREHRTVSAKETESTEVWIPLSSG